MTTLAITHRGDDDNEAVVIVYRGAGEPVTTRLKPGESVDADVQPGPYQSLAVNVEPKGSGNG